MRIAPSILSANFMDMGRDVALIEAAGADLVHVDVMDGHFVPNLTVGVPFVKQLAGVTTLPLDVHLMIDNPLVELPWFIETRPQMLTVHYEAFDDDEAVFEALTMIKDEGVACCLSLKPDTPVEKLAPFLPRLDMVLMMSVYPGFSGQSYIEGTEDRIAELVRLARPVKPDLAIQVDGGISAATIGKVARAGADVCVMGSACFGADDPARAIAEAKAAAAAALAEEKA